MLFKNNNTKKRPRYFNTYSCQRKTVFLDPLPKSTGHFCNSQMLRHSSHKFTDFLTQVHCRRTCKNICIHRTYTEKKAAFSFFNPFTRLPGNNIAHDFLQTRTTRTVVPVVEDQPRVINYAEISLRLTGMSQQLTANLLFLPSVASGNLHYPYVR